MRYLPMKPASSDPAIERGFPQGIVQLLKGAGARTGMLKSEVNPPRIRFDQSQTNLQQEQAV